MLFGGASEARRDFRDFVGRRVLRCFSVLGALKAIRVFRDFGGLRLREVLGCFRVFCCFRGFRGILRDWKCFGVCRCFP